MKQAHQYCLNLKELAQMDFNNDNCNASTNKIGKKPGIKSAFHFIEGIIAIYTDLNECAVEYADGCEEYLLLNLLNYIRGHICISSRPQISIHIFLNSE